MTTTTGATAPTLAADASANPEEVPSTDVVEVPSTDVVAAPVGEPPTTDPVEARTTRPGLVGRAKADGVTGPAVVALATALVGVGVAVDLRKGSSVSLGTVVMLLVAAVAAPAVVRFRSLATAAVLPPLLMVGAAAAVGRLSGQNHGTRELTLDVGTTLALWAPALFGAVVASLLVVLVRVGHRLIR